MAPSAEIYIDRVGEVEEGIKKLGGVLYLGSTFAPYRVWDIKSELVGIGIQPNSRTAIVKCGESAAAVLEKAGVINFSNPDPDLVVIPKIGVTGP